MTDLSPTQPASRRQVDEIADSFVEAWAALSPLTATYLGIAGHDSELPDLSLDGYQAREDLVRRTLAQMRPVDPVDERGLAAKEAFLERMTVSLEQYAAKTPQSQVSVIESELHSLRSAFDLMNTDGDEAWEAIESRLSSDPGGARRLSADAVSLCRRRACLGAPPARGRRGPDPVVDGRHGGIGQLLRGPGGSRERGGDPARQPRGERAVGERCV